jgi:DNA-binding NtrC family response regulator
MLAALPWPGNVRELSNVVERLLIMSRGGEIGVDDLRAAGIAGRPDGAGAEKGGGGAAGELKPLSPGAVLGMGGLVEARRRFEASCIAEALRGAGGNVSEAARLLGIDRTNLHKKIQSYGINTENPNET